MLELSLLAAQVHERDRWFYGLRVFGVGWCAGVSGAMLHHCSLSFYLLLVHGVRFIKRIDRLVAILLPWLLISSFDCILRDNICAKAFLPESAGEEFVHVSGVESIAAKL